MSSFSSALRPDYLFADKYDFTSNWVFPKNRVPYSMLRYIISGSAKFSIDNDDVVVSAGQIIYIPDGSMLCCQALDEGVSFISIRFISSISSGMVDVWTDQYGEIPTISCQDEFIKECFFNILHERDSEGVGKSYKIRGYLELIIGYVLEQGNGYHPQYCSDSLSEVNDNYSMKEIIKRYQDPNIKVDLRIQSVVEYLVSHQSEKIVLGNLCKMVELSPSAFRKVFKQNTGKSPTDFITELKMMNSARRLLSTNDRIQTISDDLGFETQNYFSRLFKRFFGCSPFQYRQISRK